MRHFGVFILLFLIFSSTRILSDKIADSNKNKSSQRSLDDLLKSQTDGGDDYPLESSSFSDLSQETESNDSLERSNDWLQPVEPGLPLDEGEKDYPDSSLPPTVALSTTSEKSLDKPNEPPLSESTTPSSSPIETVSPAAVQAPTAETVAALTVFQTSTELSPLITDPFTTFNQTFSEDDLSIVSSNKTTKATTSDENKTTERPKQPTVKTIHVEIKGNTTVQLPMDEVKLEAVVTDKLLAKEISYAWTVVKQPEGSSTQMVKQGNSIQCSKLIAGIYLFEVKVTSKEGQGEAHANVTVRKALRVNRPPQAVVVPVTQEIFLPINKALIDASGSTDDDGINSYLWELVQGPIQGTSQNSVGHDKILQLDDLKVGNYTYELTVTDTDGESSKVTAYVKVKERIDRKPVANAGPNEVIRLPQDSITLYGNQSYDDLGIEEYKWSIDADSPVTSADLSGTGTMFLHVSKMSQGEYVFKLVVTDGSGQTDTAKVTIIVEPKSNDPPKAVAGPDQEKLMPPEEGVDVELSGAASSDDVGIVSYQWEQIGTAPAPATILSPTSVDTKVTGLRVAGDYKFRLTVTDKQDEKNSDEMTVTIKEERAPVADAGADLVLVLPDDLAILDGSNSRDDYGIEKWTWSRDRLSPAIGRVLNGSDRLPRLQVAGLAEGSYTFHLRIVNVRGREADDSVVVEVRPDPFLAHSVELHLDVPSRALTEERMGEISKSLSILLSGDEVIIRSVFLDHHAEDLVVLFYVKRKDTEEVMKASEVIAELKPKLKADGNLLGVKVKRIDTYQCENPCSGHGRCHSASKECECDVFWMENFLRVYAGDGVRNCDWSVLYVVIVSFILVAIGVSVLYFLLCYLCRPKMTKLSKRRKQSKDYIKLNGRIKSTRKNGIRGSSNNGYSGSSLMRSMSSSTTSHLSSEDDDEGEQMTLFEKRKLIGGSVPPPRGKARNGKRRSQHHRSHRGGGGGGEESATLVTIDREDDDAGSDFDGLGLDTKNSTDRL